MSGCQHDLEFWCAVPLKVFIPELGETLQITTVTVSSSVKALLENYKAAADAGGLTKVDGRINTGKYKEIVLDHLIQSVGDL